jgi:hypothetical protein
MKIDKYLFLLAVVFSFFNLKSYAGGCSPSTTVGTCATAATLTPDAACTNGTTCTGGTGSTAGACIPATGYECSWYKFVATASAMYVNVAYTATSGCYSRTTVFSGSCASLTSLSCMTGAPLDDVHNLTGLTVGNTYFIQVCYAPGGPCGNGGSFEYCISTGIPTPPCNNCSTPCGTAQGFATAPTVATVVAGCTAPVFTPPLQPSSTNTFCNTFTATNTTVNFNVIITSNCGAGNVTNFSWSLYNSPSCGAAIQTGTLAGLTFTGLTVGNKYVFCYTFDVPSTCTHTMHCPYFVGATALPVTLTSFNALQYESKIKLDWTTETEINNDYFTVERSKDGKTYEVVDIVLGNGNSNNKINYTLMDAKPHKGLSYYRLKQTDYDGNFEYFNPIAVEIKSTYDDFNIFPNPVSGNGFLTFNSLIEDNKTIVIYDISGRLVYEKLYNISKGNNKLPLETKNLTKGMYFIKMINEDGVNLKFIKD